MRDNAVNIRKLLEEALIPLPITQEKKKKMLGNMDARKIYMNKTFSVTLGHINMVHEMADELTAREGALVSDGEVVRRAVDALYSATFNEPVKSA